MSWLTSLNETYDNFAKSGLSDKTDPIIQVGFIEKNVLFTVYLNKDGAFHSASKNDKKTILIPSSPSAAGRTGSPTPYPLYDELRYMAGDLSEIIGLDFNIYFENYIKALRDWSGIEGSPCALSILLAYLEKKTLTKDLQGSGCISEKDLSSDSSKEKIYKGMVEFRIYDESAREFVGIAEMPDIQKGWRERLIASLGNVGFCCASGENVPITDNHPKLFGNTKLISSKDAQRIFQYKGRFTSADEACTIGYETSEKAHNTLRWLIKRQGFSHFNLNFVAWSKECCKVVQPADDFAGLFDLDAQIELDTAEDYSKLIASRLSGYQKNPAYAPSKQVILIGLEAATPGRISINYYEELGGNEYLDRLGRWYKNCFWRINWYGKDKKYHTGIVTPSVDKIGNTVFGRDAMISASRDLRGEKSGTKLIRHFYLDMLSCIAGGRRMPIGYTMTAYHRVLRPQSFRDRNGRWQRNDWIDCMGVALAMLKSADIKEEYNVALNEQEKDRSYLFGRLLAVADVMESRALRELDSERMTNAVRLFTAMQQRPASTWLSLELKISQYKSKLGIASRKWYENLIDSIYNLGGEALSSNSPLSPRFIEGYHNQRYELLNKKKEN